MKRILLPLICALFLAATIYAQEQGLVSGKEYSFTETKVMPKMNKSTTRQGTMVFVSPDRLTMDYHQPAGDYTHITSDSFDVCKNGKVQHFPVKDPQDKKTSPNVQDKKTSPNVQDRMSLFRATLLYCIGGEVDKAAELNHAEKTFSNEANKRICTLTVDNAAPKDIAMLRLAYDARSSRLLSLTITEGNGNYTVYALDLPPVL